MKPTAHPSGYAPICIGTTTSARMERFTRPLMEQYGVRIIIGKGGLFDASAAAFTELGGVYLAIIGGTAALETTWIEQIEDVDLDDLNPEVAVEIPHQGLRSAAGCHGFPRRQPLHGGQRVSEGKARRRAVLAALGVKVRHS